MRSSRQYANILEGNAPYAVADRSDTGGLKIDLQRSLQLLDEAVGVSPASPVGRIRTSRRSTALQPRASSSLLEPAARRPLRDVQTSQLAQTLGSSTVFQSPANVRLLASASQASPVLASPAGRSLFKQPLNLSTSYNDFPEVTAQESRLVTFPEASFAFDESQLTSTNAALLLSEGSTDLANLGGIFVDFETATRDCAADSRAFDLVGTFVQHLESQTLLMKKLIDKVAGSQQRFRQVHTTYTLLCSELCTWRLVDSLFRDIAESEAREAVAESSARDGSDAMNVDDAATEAGDRPFGQLRSEKQLVDELFQSTASIRRRQIVVDWLETEARHRLADISGKVQFYRDGSTAAWENTLHVLKKTADARPFGVKPTSSTLVTELDPDASNRQNKDLHHLDREDEICLLKNIFAEIRAGRLDEAQALCVRCGQAWRAAALEGWRLYHDPNFFVAPSDASARATQEIEGNVYRDIWKSMCWSISEQDNIHACERAIYASLSGNLTGMLPVCEFWEDYLWAHLRASIDLQVEQHIRLSATNMLSPDRELARLPDEYWTRNITLEKIFEEIESQSERMRAEAQTCYHVMQKFIILNDVNGLLKSMQGLLSSPSGATPPAHLLRFMAHLVMFLRKIGRPEAVAAVGAAAGDEVIAAYVRQLVADKRHDLVATYASQLPPDQQVHAYVVFLEGVRDRSTRVHHLQLACDAGLDTCAITKALVESVFAKAAVKFSLISDTCLSGDGMVMSEADRVCVDALEWLTFDSLQQVEAIVKANCIMRAFIAMGKLTAAREAFARVPKDFVEAVIAEQEGPRASAVASNAVKEYLCIRAYLDAQNAFSDWFEHFHKKRPQPPAQSEPAASAGLAEQVALEQRAKQYENDVQRWRAASQLQATTAVEKLYNVLLFPDGGWMVDNNASFEPGMAMDDSTAEAVGDGGRTEQLAALRRLCLPMMTTLLVTIFDAIGRHMECLRLADLIASEQHRLYEAFSKDDLHRLLLRLRESSLALLDSNADPLGYTDSEQHGAIAS